MHFDLIVIGSGPAGYVGAILAAQHGKKVAIIEKNSTLGGTCLNIGCIPTKALLFSAYMFDKAKHLDSFGIKVPQGEITLDFPQVNQRKNDIVKTITSGVAFLMKKNKIQVFQGLGTLEGVGQVNVTMNDGSVQNLSSDYILLATGSKVKALPHIPIDGDVVVSSDHMLSLNEVPQTLAVIGGGVIGCEMASVYSRFGSGVHIFEMAPQILPLEDADIGKELTRCFKKQGIKVSSKCKIIKVEKRENKGYIYVEGNEEPFVFDKILLSVGRSPQTENIGLEKLGIETERGFVKVNMSSYQTNIPSIYAVGDIIPTPQLAHTASAEAMFAVEHMLGKSREPLNYDFNPGVVYTYPEVASVGLNEEKLKERGISYKVGKFPFTALGKARIDDCTDGFIKILTHGETGEILGAHMCGGKVSELIHSMAIAMNGELTVETLAQTIHPHPTLSEAIMEAAHAALGHAIHI